VTELPSGRSPSFDEGYYQLVLSLPSDREIEIGALGSRTMPAGIYIYTGSARKRLRARLARHRTRKKMRRWHIDYLLEHAEIIAVYVFTVHETSECLLAAQAIALPKAEVIVPGFGSSDCGCRSHLVWLPELGAVTPRC